MSLFQTISLLPAAVKRLSEHTVEVRWNPTASHLEVSVCRGDSRDAIRLDAPLARVKQKSSVILSGLPIDRPHFFKLMAGDGNAVIVGERRPLVEGCPNLRDLGGYETTDGRRVKWGLIFRAGHLGRLTDRGLEQIKRLGIKTACDFRTEAEALKLPNRFPNSPDVAYIRLPIQHGDFEPTTVFNRIRQGDYEWISEDFMVQGYIESVERYPEVWGRLLHLLCDSRRLPLLFHCTGGKDRTGAAAALILLALGVPMETVVADYGLSDGYNVEIRKVLYDQLQTLGVDLTKVEPYFTAPPSRIRALLKHVDAHYGSAVNYLVKRAGVSAKTIARLQNDILE